MYLEINAGLPADLNNLKYEKLGFWPKMQKKKKKKKEKKKKKHPYNC